MTDVNGALVYKGQFDPYGQALSEWSATGNTSLNTKKFTGYERDAATGLDYANARIYNSHRGRFTRPDPKGLGSARRELPETLNRYAYANNAPVNHMDPTGEDWTDWIRFFAESACREQGLGYFSSISFMPGGQVSFLCDGGRPVGGILTKQELLALGEWTPRSLPGRITLNRGGVRGGDIKDFISPSTSINVALPSCTEKTKFRVFVDFRGFNISEFVAPKNDTLDTSDTLTSDEDKNREPPILGQQASGFDVKSDGSVTFWLDIILIGTESEIRDTEKHIRFKIVAIDREGERQEVYAKVKLNCPEKSED
ncbi:MAG: RHS repeat-associated core domain-containing protein [Acidobacteria bacterium]|nr:RHS repeat-associated core domain-containing protein [Acidobacteriota bacterium]